MSRFTSVWKTLGWICYLALALLLLFNFTMDAILGGWIMSLGWIAFVLGLTAAMICIVVCRRRI